VEKPPPGSPKTSPDALYKASNTLPDPLPVDPIPLLIEWYEHAKRERVQPNPDSMTLATVDAESRPSARIVLCKSIEPQGGLLFYTNYTSRKARDMEVNTRVAVVFHWDVLDRQARVEGAVERLSAGESDVYFARRPWASRVGAWASEQSRPLDSRAALIRQVHETMKRFGIDPSNPPAPDTEVYIPRPPQWGGYRLKASAVELWAGGASRVHDRARWEREHTSAGDRTLKAWRGHRLQP